MSTDRSRKIEAGVLMRVADWLAVPYDRATAARHLESSRRESGEASSIERSALALSARRAGLRVAGARMTLDQALENLTRDTPLLALVVDGSGEQRWIALLDRRGRRVLAVLEPEQPPEWVRRDAIERAVEGTGDAALDWLMVHAASPCARADASASAGDAPPTPWTRLMGILRPDRSDLWAVVVFAVAIGGLLLATPVAVQALVNFVAFGGAVAPVVVLALILAVGLGFAALLTALQTWIVEILQRRIFVRMVADLAHRLPRVHRQTQDRTYAPELVNRFFDVITVQKMSSLLLLDGIGVFLGVTIGLVVLAFYHPILLAFDMLIVLSVSVIVFLMGRSGVRTAIGESKTKYAVASWLEDVARSPITFGGRQARDFVASRADELTRDYIHARRTHYRVLFGQILGMLGLQVMASVALLGIGGILVIRGELTLGQLVASELIVAYVVGSIAKMGKHFESYYDLMAAVDKIGNLLDLPLERGSGETWSAPGVGSKRGARVRLHDVTITGHGGHPLFERFALEIHPGEHLGITGADGTGKSTLIDLLYGAIDPDTGFVEVDDLDIRSLRLDTLREQAAYVGEPEIFDGSILENVLLGRAIPTETVYGVLREVGLLDTVASLPDGIHTRLTARGVPLSQGRLRRLMLARAIVGAPRLLLVDAALDTLDSRSAGSMMDLLEDRDAPWTLVVVSNRREILDRCDRVVDLSALRVSAQEAVS